VYDKDNSERYWKGKVMIGERGRSDGFLRDDIKVKVRETKVCEWVATQWDAKGHGGERRQNGSSESYLTTRHILGRKRGKYCDFAQKNHNNEHSRKRTILEVCQRVNAYKDANADTNDIRGKKDCMKRSRKVV